MSWKDYLKEKYYRNELIITVVLLILVLFAFTNFLNFNEDRMGISLPDPLLAMFSPVNLTWLTFILIYISIILALVSLSLKPDLLVLVFQAYTLMLVIRMAMMFLLPLNPPAGIIPLNDPFVQNFGIGRILTKDLFFSGHTSTMFLLFLTASNEKLKKIFLFLTILTGLSVLIQHVHYVVDVASAPFFAYVSYRLVYLLQTKKLQMSIISK